MNPTWNKEMFNLALSSVLAPGETPTSFAWVKNEKEKKKKVVEGNTSL